MWESTIKQSRRPTVGQMERDPIYQLRIRPEVVFGATDGSNAAGQHCLRGWIAVGVNPFHLRQQLSRFVHRRAFLAELVFSLMGYALDRTRMPT